MVGEPVSYDVPARRKQYQPILSEGRTVVEISSELKRPRSSWFVQREEHGRLTRRPFDRN